ncbi:hypothetical protein C1T31_10410 [Hanstruepera neustonica]|uniref:DUF3311 domain-containing protein n=1 Tax=Hanstruepera neustonica TaxID=1445657 RepID=A0A2K1DXH5_9FLAO|nr:hypothetical protein [Hanstruepera neustonica]PNQ72729.1 hypothetical protein C1T31_10410 [Hanstruepera neustonica]
MKKRHEQKLVVLALALLLLFNVPFLFIFNMEGQVLGIPVIYFSIFAIWCVAIIISYMILKRHYE